MVFNSLTFIVFLAVTSMLYWVLPRRPRVWMLVLASMLFYGCWSFAFLGLLMASVCLDYTAGRLLADRPDGWRRSAIMAAAVTINLGLLGFFKYALFFVDQANGLAAALGAGPDAFALPFQIVLPLGISFYTFQSMSYTIDVWRRNAPAERDFALFTAYVIYFPQLVAGPILRAGEVMWQLDRRPAFSWDNVAAGLSRMLGGLFLKCVLADNIAILVDRGFRMPAADLGALDVVVLAFLFGFQIYFDFAGYSHIAIGSARIMGIGFPENFDFPYLAATPRDFWRRWHISLSSWIRDYLYLPLCGCRGGRRSVDGLDVTGRPEVPPGRRVFALWATWFLMGLWHGANWTFALWGLWHAGLVTIQRVAGGVFRRSPPAALCWIFTLPAVMLGWIPFRAGSLGATFDLWGRVFGPGAWLRPPDMASSFPFWVALHRDSYYLCAGVMLAVVLAWIHHRHVAPILARRPALLTILDAATFAAMAPLTYFFLRPTTQFIYFQF